MNPKIQTKDGPNLYEDRFEPINVFYIRVWKERMEFLEKALPKIVRKRPNTYYCPLNFI
ncbi:MAG: hypothetical protein GF311_12790 [Candidatus Lokiarchaeota archaeon]|nr:hypothetical protein [Candidatus Lokiarchaeota archaeon]